MTTMQTGSKASTTGAAAIAARFERRAAGQTGPRCRVLVSGAGSKDIDVSCNLTGAIAHALWQARGGDSTSNWCDAERILDQLAGMPTTEPGITPAPATGLSGGSRSSAPEIVVGGKKKFSRQ
jgi:hypothetical protein